MMSETLMFVTIVMLCVLYNNQFITYIVNILEIIVDNLNWYCCSCKTINLSAPSGRTFTFMNNCMSE